MYCNKCGKQLSNNAAFCNGCGTSLNRPSAQFKSAVRSAASSVFARIENKDSMRFIMAGLAAVCALLLFRWYGGLIFIDETVLQATIDPQRYGMEFAENWARFSRMVSVILPVAWALGLAGFCGLVFGVVAVFRKMDGGKQLLRFSLVVSALAGSASLSTDVAMAITGMGLTESMTSVSVGVLLCSIAGLFLMRMSPRLLSYPEDASKRSVSGILIALVFFMMLMLLQSGYTISGIRIVSQFGTYAFAVNNVLTAASSGTMWASLGWSLLLCSITAFALRGRLSRFGLKICFGVGAFIGVIRAVSYYSSLHSSIMRLGNDAQFLGSVQQLELFPAVQIFLFHCLLALFIYKAVNRQVRFRAAIITPIVFIVLQFFLTYVLSAGNLGFPQLGLLGTYFAQILAIAISMIIIGFVRAPYTKQESDGVKQSMVAAKGESIIAQDSAPLFTPPPEEDGQAAESDDQPVLGKGIAPKKWLRMVLNILIMLFVAVVCFIMIVVLPRVLDGDMRDNTPVLEQKTSTVSIQEESTVPLKVLSDSDKDASKESDASSTFPLTQEGAKLYQTAISAASNFSIGLKTDGTVIATVENSLRDYIDRLDESYPSYVSGWRDIVAVSASSGHTVGLKKDGTVVSVGNIGYGQRYMSDWKDIIAISAGSNYTLGLKSDGTVLSTTFPSTAKMADHGQTDVGGWQDIVAICDGEFITAGLKTDGTVVTTTITNKEYGEYYPDVPDVSGWKDIVAIDINTSYSIIYGLKSDGTVISSFGDSDVLTVSGIEKWRDIVAISANGSSGVVGLKADGTVVANWSNGRDDLLQTEIASWNNIVAISAGETYVLGLKADGSVVSTSPSSPDSDYGQTEVSSWQDIGPA